jgi:hypothetical protein
MFGESHDFLPIWLKEAILELKMAANSTYWMAKPDLSLSRVWGIMDPCFGLNRIIFLPKRRQQEIYLILLIMQVEVLS